MNRDRVNKMIQRTAQIVNGVTEQQRPPPERRRLQDRDNDAVTCEVAIDLARERVRCFLNPGCQFLVENASMADRRRPLLDVPATGRIIWGPWQKA